MALDTVAPADAAALIKIGEVGLVAISKSLSCRPTCQRSCWHPVRGGDRATIQDWQISSA